MSGHSHWATIKRKKAVTDAARARMVGKLIRAVMVAAREGDDPQTNPKLRQAIEKAKEVNIPRETIERAVKRGVGGEGEAGLEELLIDAYGPGGVPLLIEAITDNRNRTLSEIRSLLQVHGGKAGGEGTTRWLFRPVVIATLTVTGNQDETTLALMDSGADEIDDSGERIQLLIKPEKLSEVLEYLKRMAAVSGYELQYVRIPTQLIPLNDTLRRELRALCESLEEHSDVQGVYVAASFSP